MILAALNIIDKNSLPQVNNPDQSTIDKFLNIAFITIGTIAILMIVIAGLRYIFAQGDPQKITQAKNMIVYTVIGIVLAASAGAIVSVVLGRV